MERKTDRQLTYNTFKRKKNSILFLLIIPAIIMLGSFLILYFGNLVNKVHLGTIYIPLMIIYIIMVLVLTPKLYYYRMHADYARLLINEPKLHDSKKQLFTTLWIDQIKSDGYQLVQEDMRHLLLCKHYKKLPTSPHSEETLVFIAVAKNKDFDFYGDEIDHGIQAFYMKHKAYEKIEKRITLQFKKYDAVDEKVTEEVETAILYQTKRQVLVNLTFAYIKDSVLGLNPIKWYPNRYVYFAFTEFKRLCDIKE